MRYRYLVVDDESLARKLIISHATKIEGLDLAGECGNAMEAASALRQHPVDLIFLDIQMPEIDGLQFIRTLKNRPSVIFTTAHRDFAVDAFELDAIDYLLKPISFERLLKATNKFFDQESNRELRGNVPADDGGSIYLKADRKIHKVHVGDIAYIESLDEYVKVHMTEKILISRETITSLQEKLAPFSFVRIHRSFLVASRFVTAVSGDGAEVRGKLLPFGRTYKLSALAQLGIPDR